MAGAMINHIVSMGVAIRHRSFSGGIYIFRGKNIKLELLFHDPKGLSIGEEMIQVWGGDDYLRNLTLGTCFQATWQPGSIN